MIRIETALEAISFLGVRCLGLIIDIDNVSIINEGEKVLNRYGLYATVCTDGLPADNLSPAQRLMNAADNPRLAMLQDTKRDYREFYKYDQKKTLAR